ncbi:putative WRKY transcription factor 2 [Tasmannia lanceolata]|uniref:putative WRKY transcription factor 2 n=1 Tax=Tasmannia lanceolata TaxID=3420 RepID=UPI004062E715
MAEREESSSRFGDWRALISSPRALISSPRGLFSDYLSDIFASRPNTEKVEDFRGRFQKKADNGGSIAERRAASFGFSPRLNTARFRSDSPLTSPAIRSPYFEIPPGLSPATLLDSPVMLSNSQAQPSPTTGTFPFPSFSHEIPITSNTNKSEDFDSSFIFKPHVDPASMSCLSSAENQAQHLWMADVNHQAPARIQSQVDIECQAGFLQQNTTKNYANEYLSELDGAKNLMVKAKSINLQDQAPQHETSHEEDTGSQQNLEEDQKGSFPPLRMGMVSEDGYNWRKYGQKQVKGSEFPRSYYKCTHPNCEVKKKVERSHDGQLTEIIYKGSHDHPKPQPSRRSAFSLNEISEMPDGLGSYVKVEGGSVWRNLQQGSKDKCGTDWRADSLEMTSSTSVVTELSDPLSTAQGKHLNVLESADTPELSSTLASHDDEEDGPTQGSISLGDDVEDVESE